MVINSRPKIILACSVLVLLLSGCALGGGTVGTGVTGLSATPGVGVRQGLLSFSARGQVKLDGASVTAGTLSVLTSDGIESVAIDRTGRFEVTVNKLPGEPVIFEIETANQLFQFETELSPAGASTVELDFLLSTGGAVKIVRAK